MDSDLARARVRACTSCSLRAGCRAPVPFRGPAPTRLLVVGEAPGEQEDEVGLPFVGRAGQLLDALWRDAGLGDFAVTNTVHCRPPYNRDPYPSEILACVPNLLLEIAAVRPAYILTLGLAATRWFRPRARAMASERGKLRYHEMTGTLILPTYHPAYALRDPSARSIIATDLTLLAAVMWGWRPDVCEAHGHPVEWYETDGEPKCEACLRTQDRLPGTTLPPARPRSVRGDRAVRCERCGKPAGGRVVDEASGMELDVCGKCGWRLGHLKGFAPA